MISKERAKLLDFPIADDSYLNPVRNPVEIFPGVYYEPDRLRLTRDKKTIYLYPLDAMVFELLVENPDTVYSNESISKQFSITDVYNKICQLRRAANVLNIDSLIKTVNRKGYAFSSPSIQSPIKIHPQDIEIMSGFSYSYRERAIKDNRWLVTSLSPRMAIVLEKFLQYPNTFFPTKLLMEYYTEIKDTLYINSNKETIWVQISNLKKILPRDLQNHLITPNQKSRYPGYAWMK